MIITRDFIENLNFQRISKEDLGFDTKSPAAWVSFVDDYIVTIDGGYCEVTDLEGEILDTCEDVCEL